MHLLFIASLLLLLLPSCATVSQSKLQFKSSAEAEAYLKANKACPGCDLRRAELAYSDLRGADLQGANLKGADFTHADLRGANLKGAILRRVDLSTAPKLEGADLRETDMTEANILPSELALAQTCGSILPDGRRSTPCSEKH